MSADDIWPPRERWVGAWLLVVCAFVVLMILVGGATRLTDSGLSITEWDLGKGLTPPLTDARWQEEFLLYQHTMEYQTQNNGMTLEEFRHIYWWEWIHRFLGKLLGLVFAIPALILFFMGRLRGRFRVTLLLFVLGASQGAIGWWMVTSGLFDRLDVSPLRLAIHLGMALTILAIALHVALGALGWPVRARSGAPRGVALALIFVLFAQAMFGAFLAGSDGGAAYADWPQIGGEWIPSSAFGLEPFFSNFTEDHATQHLMHRTLGYVAALFALVLGALVAVRGEGAALRWWGLGLATLAVAQAGLGIMTVLSVSPLGLSLAHQAGAVALWISVVVIYYSSHKSLK